MSDEGHKSTIWTLWQSIGRAMLVLAASGLATIATPEGVVTLPTKLLSALVAGLAGIVAVWIGLTRTLLKQTSDSRVIAQFKHDTTADISIERAGSHKGRRVCTKCLHETPAHVCPLAETPFGHDQWMCRRCDSGYRDDTLIPIHNARREVERQKHQKQA